MAKTSLIYVGIRVTQNEIRTLCIS